MYIWRYRFCCRHLSGRAPTRDAPHHNGFDMKAYFNKNHIRPTHCLRMPLTLTIANGGYATFDWHYSQSSAGTRRNKRYGRDCVIIWLFRCWFYTFLLQLHDPHHHWSIHQFAIMIIITIHIFFYKKNRYLFGRIKKRIMPVILDLKPPANSQPSRYVGTPHGQLHAVCSRRYAFLKNADIRSMVMVL